MSETPNSVAIVGLGRSHQDYIFECAAHGSRKAVADETWAINAMTNIIQWDLAIAMDHPELPFIKEKIEKGLNSYKGYQMFDEDRTILSADTHPDYPAFKKYPLEDVINCIKIPYLNNSVSYALAYAILKEVPTVKMYGLDFFYPGEDDKKHIHEAGRSNVEFLIGIALSRGMAIHIAQNSSLLDNNVPLDQKFYGYLNQPKTEWNGKGWEIKEQTNGD
jgi:hypothetical protein